MDRWGHREEDAARWAQRATLDLLCPLALRSVATLPPGVLPQPPGCGQETLPGWASISTHSL